jgi:hypothetical protein
MCLDSSSKSSSDSSQTSNTTNTDMRIAGGDGSVNVSAQGSTITLALSDQGAIHEAFGFATNTVNGALAEVSANDSSTQSQVTAALKSVSDAYSTSKAGEQKVLVGMGLIVVGLVAVTALKRA